MRARNIGFSVLLAVEGTLFLGTAWHFYVGLMLLGLIMVTMGLWFRGWDWHLLNPEIRQRYTDEGAAELNEKPVEVEDDFYSAHDAILETLSPAVRRALTPRTPEQLVTAAWMGEITAGELREALPPRQVARVPRVSEQQTREILAAHGRPYDGPITVVGHSDFHNPP